MFLIVSLANADASDTLGFDKTKLDLFLHSGGFSFHLPPELNGIKAKPTLSFTEKFFTIAYGPTTNPYGDTQYLQFGYTQKGDHFKLAVSYNSPQQVVLNQVGIVKLDLDMSFK